MEQNLTTGNVLRTIVRFSLPYLLSYFLQTLYGMADLFIIGQYEGAAATTAVSIGSQVMHMLTVMLVGLAMGTTVSIAKAVGAGDRAGAAAATGNTVTLFAGLSAALTAVLLLLVRPIIAVMSTPSEAVQGAEQYLRICFLGIPFITAYNVISSIFRGMGDSKRPMYFVAVACAANIALDYLFMGVLRLGPAGAALGTTISQAISVVISLIAVRNRNMIVLQSTDLRPKKAVLGQILRVGLPVMLQDGLIQVSFVTITIIANHRGLTDAAAVGIVEKIMGFLFLVPSAILSTVSALGAQNLGAGKPERAVAALRYAIALSSGLCLLMVGIVQLTAERLVGAFTPDLLVAAAGGQYLRGYVFDCLFGSIQFSFSGYFCARSKSGLSFLHNILSIALVRIPGAYLASRRFPQTLLPMGLASTAGSVFSVLVCLIAYAALRRKDRAVLEGDAG